MSDTITIQARKCYALSLPSGESYAVTRIGRGRFTTAYKAEDDNRVWLVVNEDAGDYSKEILMNCDGPMFPQLEKIGYTSKDRSVYLTRYYPRPSATRTPAAWRDFRALESAWQTAWRDTAAQHPKDLIWQGHEVMAGTAANLRGAGRPDLADAVDELRSAAANYGSSYTCEFAVRNLGTDGDRLVLTDPIFDMEPLEKARQKAMRKARGY